MSSLARLCLGLGALTWVAQAQDCPGDGTDMISRIKFKHHPDSEIFFDIGNKGDLGALDNIASLQECANHCAENIECQASVWNEVDHTCHRIKEVEYCQDGEPNKHSLVKVGFIDGKDDVGGCSPSEIDAKCAEKEKAARQEAEKKCAASSSDLQAEVERLRAENSALRAAKDDAQRKLANTVNEKEEERKNLIKEWQKKLDDEIELRRKAVKDAREEGERSCRSKQDKDLQDKVKQCSDDLQAIKEKQKQSENQCQADKTNLQKECDNKRNTDKTTWETKCQAEKDIINKQCEYDRNSCKEQQKQAENKCQAEKDAINDQCAHDLDASKKLQEQLKSKCEAEKDVINKQCIYDTDAAKSQQKHELDAKCQAEKDAINKQCTKDLDDAKTKQQQQLESKCQAEKDVIKNQCDRDLDAAKGQQQSECQKEKDQLDKQCKDKLAEEQKTSVDKCQKEKEQIQQDCQEQNKNQARGKDDICYNPGGYGAWPTTLPPFSVDDIGYELKPNTNVLPGYSEPHTATSPASCAKEFCNNRSDCTGIRWDVNKANTCYVFIESPYSPFEKSRLKNYNGSYMIVKSEKLK